MQSPEEQLCLLVEDDGGFIRVLTRLISQMGFGYVLVSSLNEALEIVGNDEELSRFAFILLDFNLSMGKTSNEDGFKIAKTAKQTRPNIVIVSNSGDNLLDGLNIDIPWGKSSWTTQGAAQVLKEKVLAKIAG